VSAAELWVVDLGLVDYDEALAFQRDVAAARIDGRVPEDVLILCEHPPVVTMGRSAKASNLLVPEPLLAARGIQLREVERGGDITLHAPGQLVGYPIVDLKRHKQDLHWYLRQVEQVLIDALGTLGITAGRREKLTGVWVEDRKIASIGVHARSWVTWHGFALNVSTDLSLFDVMVPCGIGGVVMTSVARELGAADGAEVRAAVTDATGALFGLQRRAVAVAELRVRLQVVAPS
jgi:lipoate-protein ligase B